jgi:two-component system sensor histidine kinase KdpD
MNEEPAAGAGQTLETDGARSHSLQVLSVWSSQHPYLTALFIVGLWTTLLLPFRGAQDETQWGLWYVLAVVAAASLAGERGAIAAALLAFGSWNFFFIAPYYTFRLARPSLWMDLTVFLVVGSVVGLQTAVRRRRERDALAREAETRLLNRLLGELATPPKAAEIPDIVLDRVMEALDPAECALYLARREGGFNRSWRPQPASWPSEIEAGVAEAFGEARSLESVVARPGKTAAGEAAALVFLPLRGPESVFGVLYVALRIGEDPDRPIRLARAIAHALTAHLEHDRLRGRSADLEALKEIDDLKTAFVNSVSHELKTPLASAMATVTGLLESSSGTSRLSPSISRELEAVVEDLHRLEANIADLLDMSRLENASWRLEPDYFEIGEVIGSVLAALPARSRERVDLSVEEDIPLVRVDFRQIARALHNLVDNALSYSPEDESVRVGARVLGDAIIVWVEDRGPGVPPQERDAVFQKFYRSPSVPRSGTSTGLGLAITKEIVTRHDGTVWVEDAQPKGSRFLFSLPLA